MEKWKIIRTLTISILCIFMIYTICLAVIGYKSNAAYPYEVLGAVQINNWVEAFSLEIIFRLYILRIPLMINIIFMIVSIIKIRKDKESS